MEEKNKNLSQEINEEEENLINWAKAQMIEYKDVMDKLGE